MGCGGSKDIPMDPIAMEEPAGVEESKGGDADRGSGGSVQEKKAMTALRGRKRGNIFAESYAAEAYVKKKYPKSKSSRKVISAALGKHFLFSTLDDAQADEVIDAMQKQEVSDGHEIIVQGDTGDNFYVVEQGSFDIFVDGSKVGSVSDGASFGELALLYNCPRAATVTSTTDALVWALDRLSFRHILAHSAHGKIEECKEALRTVPLLADLSDRQVSRLAEAVELVQFNPDEVIIRKGDKGNIFYFIKKGRVVCTEVGSGARTMEDLQLGEGDYFGERALIMNEPRAANVKALTEVVCMALDRQSFKTLLGPLTGLLDRNLGIRVLKSVPILKSLSEAEREEVVGAFNSVTFQPKEPIIRQGDRGSSFYVIKDGNVRVTQFKDGAEVEIGRLSSGDYFGEMALLNDEPRQANVIAEDIVHVFQLDRASFNRLLGPLQDIMNRAAEERKEEAKEAHGRKAATTINFRDLQERVTLGTGTFGRVKLVKHRKTGETYAMKILQKAQIVKYRQQNNVLNEKRILSQLDHPFILQLIATSHDEDRLFMLLEFVQGGELFNLLFNRGSRLPAGDAKFYAACVLCVFEYLHRKKIVYRDLKPENLLIDSVGYLKVADFGFAKIVADRTYTLCGTPEYLAPELVLGKGHNKGVDYWALGILIFEMLCGYSPFADEEMRNEAICRNIIRHNLEFPKTLHDSRAKDLMKKLLVKNFVKRLGCGKLGAREVKEHPWFRDIRWDELMAKEIKAPWIPPLASPLDTSHFGTYEEEDDVEPYYDDGSGWDADF